ncbi:MAG: NAD+ synthase, partial [Stellaceae bacterium]
MTDRLTIALAQLDPTVGDIAGNLARFRKARAEAAAMGADLIASTELFVAGYPPEDLVLKPSFVAACEGAVIRFAREMGPGPAVIIGTPWRQDGRLYNAAALLDGGKVAALRFKYELPNYGVFDEKRVFAPGPAPGPVVVKGVRIGVMICEDMWVQDPAESLAESGAELLLVINGSPYECDKRDVRMSLAVARVTESRLPLLYVNQVSGQDELVFDGGSFVLGADRALRVQAPDWREMVVKTDWRRRADGSWTADKGILVRPSAELEAIYRATVLGLGDYVGKNGFPGVVLGLSGGIDSALSAAVAVDALGADKVHCVMMPSRYTSGESLDDAAAVARLLGVDLREIDIEPAVAAFDTMLAPSFAGRGPDSTEENLQARARGITLMALSNKFGWLVLATGNKSEMSVGYSTLYGDLAGGLAVIKDVPKTLVYRLVRWRNS